MVGARHSQVDPNLLTVSRPDGWNLDDVVVQSCAVGTAIFLDDFETGATSQWSSAFP